MNSDIAIKIDELFERYMYVNDISVEKWYSIFQDYHIDSAL